jgi:hypothetical protein
MKNSKLEVKTAIQLNPFITDRSVRPKASFPKPRPKPRVRPKIP